MTKKPVAFVVHHGTTKFNEQGKYTGMINVPLSNKGISDANEVHEFLSRQHIERVLVSPLCRAVRTAEIICPNLCIQETHELFPWQFPTFWGKTKDEFDKELEQYIHNPNKRPPEGETLQEFMDRTGDFFEDTLCEHCLTLYVAHTTNLIALCDLLDGTMDHDKVIEPGGVIAIYTDEDNGGWKYEILRGKTIPAD